MTSILPSLGPLKAIRGGRTPGHPDAQTPERPGTRTAGRADAREHGHPDVRTPASADSRTAARPDTRTPGHPLQGTGKRSHPDYRKRTVFLRDSTWRAAARQWEDEGDGDFSNLVEKLLRDYTVAKGKG